MTKIQASCLPAILDGADVIGQAKTGSGKTAAFALGYLQKLNVKKFRIQTLVLCPTRELADQVANDTRRLARGIHNIKVLTLCGGVAFGPQKGSLEHGAHIIVGTPGRVEEHLRKGNLDLTHLTTLVFDEADRMLEMGFNEAIDKILARVPAKRQTLLFSATFPADIAKLAKRVTTKPHHIHEDEEHTSSSIRQLLFQIPEKRVRTSVLTAILLDRLPTSALVFCNTKVVADEVTAELKQAGFSTEALHGDIDQSERDFRLTRFANRSLSVLVATDVAARGLDIDTLDMVVNYHLSKDPEVHTHRVGRTGRAGNTGLACSLYHKSEESRIELLEGVTGSVFERAPLPKGQPGKRPPPPPMVSLQINGGRKQKIRPGDILGALTAHTELDGSNIGLIKINDSSAVVAVTRSEAKSALYILQNEKIKGRTFKARKL